MGAAENKQLIETMFAELSRGDSQAFLGHMADDVQFTIIGSTKFSGTFRGKKELIDKVLTPLTSQLEGGLAITPQNFVAEGDYVVMQATGKSTAKNGKSYDNTYAQVFRLADGKVQAVTEYLDTELVTEVFGR